jgi:hypothetical protein
MILKSPAEKITADSVRAGGVLYMAFENKYCNNALHYYKTNVY